MTLIRLSSTANFVCDNSQGDIFCTITIDGKNGGYQDYGEGLKCLPDSNYCVLIPGATPEGWKITVDNDGTACHDICPISQVCEEDMSPEYGGQTCYYQCITDAC